VYTLLNLSYNSKLIASDAVRRSLSENAHGIYNQVCTLLDVGIASADITEAHMYGAEVARSEIHSHSTAYGRLPADRRTEASLVQ
jgi:hypothetical protein